MNVSFVELLFCALLGAGCGLIWGYRGIPLAAGLIGLIIMNG